MAVVALPAEQAAELRAAPYNYEDVGETARGQRVPGYGWMERSTQLRRTDFEAAVADLFRWRVQERSGLRVQASESPLGVDTVVLMRLGVGPLSLRVPCRVVYVVDQPRLRGFAYGTLPGHPEARTPTDRRSRKTPLIQGHFRPLEPSFPAGAVAHSILRAKAPTSGSAAVGATVRTTDQTEPVARRRDGSFA
jgi:hypothetical protein